MKNPRNFLTVATMGAAFGLAAGAAHGTLVWHLPLNDGAAGTTVSSTGGADDIVDDPSHGATDAVVNGTPGQGLWVNDASRGIVFSTGQGDRLQAGTQDIDADRQFAWSIWINTNGGGTVMGNRQGGNAWSKLQPDRLNSGSNFADVDFTNVNDGTWHHVVVTGDTGSVSLRISMAMLMRSITDSAEISR